MVDSQDQKDSNGGSKLTFHTCEHQVGGHMNKADQTPDTFVDDAGNFYKPFITQDARNAREAALYQAVWPPHLRGTLPAAFSECEQGNGLDAANEHESGLLPELWKTGQLSCGVQHAVPDPKDLEGLRAFIPGFRGVVKVQGRQYMVLRDICSIYKQPCVLDVKMGFASHYDWADERYKAKCRAKDAVTMQPAIGFRVCGLQVYHQAEGRMCKHDRMWCRQITREQVLEPFQRFAGGNLAPSLLYKDPIYGILPQLHKLRAWLESQHSVQFFQASLLLTYEGMARGVADAKVQVHLIDFAHTFPTTGHRDENVLAAVQSLISVLEQCS